MKALIKSIIAYLRSKLNDRDLQDELIRVAEELAKRTSNTFDDKGVEAFRKFWKAYWSEI